MDSYHVIVFIFGIIILFILFILYFVNRLIFYKNKVLRSIFVVQKYLDERGNLMKEMEEFILNTLEHEDTLRKRIVKSSSVSSFRGDQFIKWFQTSEKVVLQFEGLDKTYSKLKKNQDYLKLCQNIENNREQILYAMEGYDKGVRDYNDYKSRRFVSILSKLFRFANYDYYGK